MTQAEAMLSSAGSYLALSRRGKFPYMEQTPLGFKGDWT